MILAFCKIHSFIWKYLSLTSSFLLLSYQTPILDWQASKQGSGETLEKQQKSQELLSSSFCAPAFDGLSRIGSEIKSYVFALLATVTSPYAPDWREAQVGRLRS